MSVRTGPSHRAKYEQCQNDYKRTGQKLLKHIALIINSLLLAQLMCITITHYTDPVHKCFL